MPLTMNQEPRTKNTKPLVSVCIGVYNRERYIRECLDSVFAQTYTDLEVIVVDDASTDRSVEILETYGDRITLIRRETNSGLPAVPRNQAIRSARGEFIAFLDSDDRWYPRKIEAQVAFLAANPAVMLVHTYCRLLDAEGREGAIRHEGVIPATGDVFVELLSHCYIATSATMMRATFFTNYESFSEERRFKIGEDYELFIRVAKNYLIGFIPEVLTAYRRAEGGISQQDAAWCRKPNDMLRLEYVYRLPSLWKDRVEGAYVLGLLGEGYCDNAAYWRDQGFPGRALWAAGKALQVNPFHRRAWAQWARSFFRLIVPIK